jgi:hypothetical protein
MEQEVCQLLLPLKVANVGPERQKTTARVVFGGFKY